jgi:hypothetical protein
MPLDQAFVMKTTFSRHTGGGEREVGAISTAHE